MNKVRYGIVGIGKMGGTHAKKLKQGLDQNGELAAVCDLSEERLAWAEQALAGVRRFADYRELLACGRWMRSSSQRRTTTIRALPWRRWRQGSMCSLKSRPVFIQALCGRSTSLRGKNRAGIRDYVQPAHQPALPGGETNH